MAIAVGAAVSVAVAAGTTAYSSSQSGGSGGGSSSSGGQAPMFNTNAGNVPNPNYTRPMGDTSIASKAQSGNVTMTSSKATEAKVTDASQVPAARDSKSTTTPEAGDVWANRLSRYLDYNTRQLG